MSRRDEWKDPFSAPEQFYDSLRRVLRLAKIAADIPSHPRAEADNQAAVEYLENLVSTDPKGPRVVLELYQDHNLEEFKGCRVELVESVSNAEYAEGKDARFYVFGTLVEVLR